MTNLRQEFSNFCQSLINFTQILHSLFHQRYIFHSSQQNNVSSIWCVTEIQLIYMWSTGLGNPTSWDWSVFGWWWTDTICWVHRTCQGTGWIQWDKGGCQDRTFAMGMFAFRIIDQKCTRSCSSDAFEEEIEYWYRKHVFPLPICC